MKQYQELIQNALLGVVKEILKSVAQEGLSGEQHFYITFDTRPAAVEIPAFLKQRYPDQMTIVLQHQFDELNVTDDSFSVLLSFNGKPERLVIPFGSILTFADPSQQFALQFMPTLGPEKKHNEEPAQPAQVISLDAIRKKQ